jgi:aldose 1-epimerase
VSEAAAPSGRQFELRHRDQVAVVTEVGATLRRYAAGDREILDGFDLDEVCGGGRGQHLIPWPNRVRDGRYELDGKQLQLALTEPLNGNAIHGLTRWANWQPESVADDHVSMTLTVYPQPGWPGTLEVALRVDLGDDGLTITTTARNSGSVPLPYGTGAHAYLTVGGDTVDDAVLTTPASTYLLPDDRGIPVGPTPVDGTRYDFRPARAIGDLVLDTAYKDLTRDDDGRWRVRLSDNETGAAVTLWADETYGWLQLFTGDTLSPDKARAGLAVEPMTCGPDAFNTGDGLILLQPGDRHEGQWGIAPR